MQAPCKPHRSHVDALLTPVALRRRYGSVTGRSHLGTAHADLGRGRGRGRGRPIGPIGETQLFLTVLLTVLFRMSPTKTGRFHWRNVFQCGSLQRNRIASFGNLSGFSDAS